MKRENGGNMKVGNYQIGRYRAIIKKEYEDGSADYETSFSDACDLMESIHAIELCIGKKVGVATDNARVLVGYKIIRGANNIKEELERRTEDF